MTVVIALAAVATDVVADDDIDAVHDDDDDAVDDVAAVAIAPGNGCKVSPNAQNQKPDNTLKLLSHAYTIPYIISLKDRVTVHLDPCKTHAKQRTRPDPKHSVAKHKVRSRAVLRAWD